VLRLSVRAPDGNGAAALVRRMETPEVLQLGMHARVPARRPDAGNMAAAAGRLRFELDRPAQAVAN
jgi:hypothetical protein